jgi:hypothetical protein
MFLGYRAHLHGTAPSFSSRQNGTGKSVTISKPSPARLYCPGALQKGEYQAKNETAKNPSDSFF